jgi:hypothetical protein
MLTLFTIGLSFFFVLISIIVLLSRSDDVAFMKEYDTNISNGMKIFNLFVLYSWLIPTNLFLILDLIHFIFKFKCEKEMIEIYKN